MRGGLLPVAEELRREVSALSFGPPVETVYDPLDYAWDPHAEYLRRYGGARPEVLLLGMNPGPWGMAQTGVPFGDVGMVRDFLGIGGRVGRPPGERPDRPVTGFACRRGEGSGRRLWGWARERFGSPDAFFARFFVVNYCPLIFFGKGGGNLTPDKLPAAQRAALLSACDRALVRTAQELRPRLVAGVGRWAEARAREALAGMEVKVGGIPHPSPANPAANRGWAKAAEAALGEMGVVLDGIVG